MTVVAANVELPDPAGADVIRVATAEELRSAVLEAATGADAVVMAAAVADYRPVRQSGSKLKKDGSGARTVELTENPDVLAELVRARSGAQVGSAQVGFTQVIVGFAAETDDVLAAGRAKLARKGCDLLVVNDVGQDRAFGTDDNAAVILGSEGTEVEVPLSLKETVADAVWDAVVQRL